jgi:hypothetical protein
MDEHNKKIHGAPLVDKIKKLNYKSEQSKMNLYSKQVLDLMVHEL